MIQSLTFLYFCTDISVVTDHIEFHLDLDEVKKCNPSVTRGGVHPNSSCPDGVDTASRAVVGGTPDNDGNRHDKHAHDKGGGLIETDSGGIRGVWDRAKASFGHLDPM